MKKETLKKYIKRVVAILSTCSIFVCIWLALSYLAVDNTSSYTRIMMREFYNQENIDVLFCGASLCYRSFDTEILDKGLGANTFNSGSSSQDIDVSYYIIKEALMNYDVKQIYLELSPIIAMNTGIEERTLSNMLSAYIIADYIKPTITKGEFIVSRPDYLIESVLPARRNWDKLFDKDYIATNLQRKNNDVYRNYQYDFLHYDTEWYAGKGYVESSYRVEDGYFDDRYGKNIISLDKISDDWYQYLNKIVKVCKNEDVELTLVCTPFSEYLINIYGEGYISYHNMVQEIADDAGIIFWDFNLLKEESIAFTANQFKDSAHLNMYGAQAFSELFAKLVSQELSFDEISYKNINDKLEGLEPSVLGIIREESTISIVASHPENLEFVVSAIPEEGEEYYIEDFAPNLLINISPDETGILHIICTVKGSSESAKEYFYAY